MPKFVVGLLGFLFGMIVGIEFIMNVMNVIAHYVLPGDQNLHAFIHGFFLLP